MATVFSKAGPLPWSIPAYRALAEYRRDPFALYEVRRQEDLAVLGTVPARVAHLGYCDALFRTRHPTDAPRTTRLRRVGSRIPCYPTFRWDLARGRVAQADRGLVDQVAASLTELANQLGPPAVVVFAPLGVGRNVDHLITRGAAAWLGLPVIYYSDFPYSESALPDRTFLEYRNLVPHLWYAGREANATRVQAYRSQFLRLFPAGHVPPRPEVYWLPVAATIPTPRRRTVALARGWSL